MILELLSALIPTDRLLTFCNILSASNFWDAHAPTNSARVLILGDRAWRLLELQYLQYLPYRRHKDDAPLERVLYCFRFSEFQSASRPKRFIGVGR